MSRQRTVNDQQFWRSPCLISCTTEDRIALIHLLTCPDSNVIGAYSIIPRIAGAEIGWTAEQWLQVVERLRDANLIWYDPEKMFVWVRIWWDHHHASQTMGPKLRNRLLEDIQRLPEQWRQPFLEDFRSKLNKEQQVLLDSFLIDNRETDTISIPYPYPIDMVSNLSRHNPNVTPTLTPTLTPTPTPAAPPQDPVDMSEIPQEHRPAVGRALAKNLQAKTNKASPQAIVNEVARQFKSNNPPLYPSAFTNHIARKNLPDNEKSERAPRPTPSELADLEGRCYAWPAENPICFAKIGANGEFKQLAKEGSRMVQRSGKLGQGILLKAIREGIARQVPASSMPEMKR